MSMNWQLGAALQPFGFEAFHNNFVQDDLGFANIFDEDSNDVQSRPYFASDAPTTQQGAFPRTASDEFNQVDWSYSNPSGSLQVPGTRGPVRFVDPEVFHQNASLGNLQNIWNTNGAQAEGTSGVGASLSTLPDLGDVAVDHFHPSANVTSQQLPYDFSPLLSAEDTSSSLNVPTADFDSNALLNLEGAGQVGFGGIQQLHVEEYEQSQDTTPMDRLVQKKNQTSKGKAKKPRATPKPSKPRAKKAANIQQATTRHQTAASDDTATSDTTADVVIVPVPEPDENYAFAVTDMNDVYLDPKPQLSFGKHEPHLVPKVATAQKTIKAHKKAQESTTPTKPTMTNLHASIQARNARLMSQPGPRPQKSRVASTIQWRSPTNDTSIPTTAAAYGTCLHLLTNAICNRKGCFESENAEFRNRYFEKSTYFPEEAVASLAEQILDTMIDVHENGFAHETLDPDYDERYRKTQGFDFRDRFNLVARILKHSKNTCNELFKNFRIYDVIGGAYDLETRIYSNSLNNKRKANKEKERKAEEATKKAAKGNKQQGNAGENEQHGPSMKGQQQGTKRSLETGGVDNESTAEDNQISSPNKRVKPTDDVRPPENDPSKGDSATDQTSPGTTTEFSGGTVAVKKVPHKSTKASVTSSTASTKDSDDKSTEQRGKKRTVADTDEDKEPAAPLAKKSKTKSRPKAPKKGKSKAKPAAGASSATTAAAASEEESALHK